MGGMADAADDHAREGAPKSRPRLARSTAIFAVATGLSRVAGLVRESVSAYYFGSAGKINAFTVAFQLPNLVRALVADAALSGAFVPVFSELLEKGDRRRAWRVASTLFWLLLLALGGLTALFVLLAPYVLRLFGNPGGDIDLAVGLSRVLFPIVVLLGLTGIIVGILNTHDHFTVPALTPVFWNLAIILGLVIGVPTQHGENGKLYIYAGSIVIGTLIQFLLPLPWLRGLDGHLQVVIDWRDPAVRRFFVLLLPVTVGLGLININAVIDTIFATRLIDPSLAPTAIDKAFRLYMLPQGMFSVAVATVLFPALSRLAARADHAQFRETVALGVRQIGFLLVPAGAVSAVLAEPIVRLVYQRGAFTPGQTTVVAGALAAFSLGLVFNGWMLMLNRAFFSTAVELAADRGGARPTWRSTPCSTPRSTGSASGGSRSRRRSSTSPAPWRSPTCCARGSDGSGSARSSTRSCASSSPPASRRGLPSSSGGVSTTCSADRSRPRSCRFSSPSSSRRRLPRQLPRAPGDGGRAAARSRQARAGRAPGAQTACPRRGREVVAGSASKRRDERSSRPRRLVRARERRLSGVVRTAERGA